MKNTRSSFKRCIMPEDVIPARFLDVLSKSGKADILIHVLSYMIKSDFSSIKTSKYKIDGVD